MGRKGNLLKLIMNFYIWSWFCKLPTEFQPTIIVLDGNSLTIEDLVKCGNKNVQLKVRRLINKLWIWELFWIICENHNILCFSRFPKKPLNELKMAGNFWIKSWMINKVAYYLINIWSTYKSSHKWLQL